MSAVTSAEGCRSITWTSGRLWSTARSSSTQFATMLKLTVHHHTAVVIKYHYHESLLSLLMYSVVDVQWCCCCCCWNHDAKKPQAHRKNALVDWCIVWLLHLPDIPLMVRGPHSGVNTRMAPGRRLLQDWYNSSSDLSSKKGLFDFVLAVSPLRGCS